MNMLLALCALMGTVGCTMAATTTSAPTLDKRFTIAVDGPTVAWTARVSTGGWRLTTDRVVLDGTTLRVFATLERPGAGEMVGQAFTTLTADAPSQGATTAELSVLRTRRGEPGEAPYAVVARSGA